MTSFNLREISFPVFCLIVIYAISSWVDVISVRAEVPFMMNELPEGWNLPSYLSFANILTNVGPALYLIICRLYQGKNKAEERNTHNRKDIILSFAIISIEIVSMILISFFWNRTTYIGGSNHSIALMVLLFFSGLCSSLSNLVYLPYMARFSTRYISAYYLGNGLGGFIPGLIGLGQGLGGDPTCLNVTVLTNSSCSTGSCSDSLSQYKLVPQYSPPRFSVQIYFIIVSCLLVASLISFYCLNYTSLRQHQVLRNCSQTEHFIQGKEKDADHSKEIKNLEESITPAPVKDQKYSKYKFVIYLLLTGIVHAVMFGFFPSIQPFSSLPYGGAVFNLAIRLSFMCSALASIATMFISRPPEKLLFGITLVGLISFVYQFVLALQSPSPVLQNETIGAVLVVCLFCKHILLVRIRD